MKREEIMKNVGSTFRKVGIRFQKHSPEIFIVAGVVGGVISAVLACKATTKVNPILEKAKEDIDDIHSREEEKTEDEKPVVRQELVRVYAQTGVSLVKLYAPSVILGAVSVTSILASHNILRKRNVALGAAYAAVDKGFKEYRSRVVDRFGEVVDRELKYDIKAKKFEEVQVDPENGKEKKVKSTVEIANPDVGSEYARFFDDGCKGWSKDPEYNLMFLRAQQQFANDKLHADGFLFLNDVYDALGIPKSKAGQIVGWVYRPNDPVGDNYVDFGIYDVNRERNRDFVNGYERTILLDFNVDGNILDLI